MTALFTKKQLNTFIIQDLGKRVFWHSDINDKTFLVDLIMPKRQLRIYVFNCTCPPGGRALDEYKVQLIIEGQKRGERGHLNFSDNRSVLIIGYAVPFVDENDGIYVIWDANVHKEFSYSANLQCYLDPMLQALSDNVVTCLKKGNKEKIVVSQRKYLGDAIERRLDIDTQELLGG